MPPNIPIGLFAGLYEVGMAPAYLEPGMREEAMFSLFAQRQPRTRNYVHACGTEDMLDALAALRFGTTSLA